MAELDEEERIQKPAKAQSALDTVLQLGVSSDDTLKSMKDTVEQFRIPTVKKAAQTDSTIKLSAIGEKAAVGRICTCITAASLLDCVCPMCVEFIYLLKAWHSLRQECEDNIKEVVLADIDSDLAV